MQEQILQTPNLVYLNEVEQERVNKELERAHLLINTSTHEGLPNTFIQAWLREVPTGTIDIDPGGLILQSGIGVAARDYPTLRESVLHFASNRGKLAEMGRLAREVATSRFSMANAETLRRLVENLVIHQRGWANEGGQPRTETSCSPDS
jgi:hypothetical protein